MAPGTSGPGAVDQANQVVVGIDLVQKSPVSHIIAVWHCDYSTPTRAECAILNHYSHPQRELYRKSGCTRAARPCTTMHTSATCAPISSRTSCVVSWSSTATRSST